MILDKILKYKKEELESFKRKRTLADLQHEAVDQAPALDFAGACSRGGPAWPPVSAGHPHRGAPTRIIAEIKKASPSAGLIRPDFDPVKIARQYEENGAAAISVLTDEHFFQGSLDHLKKVRTAVSVPLLRKDFVFDHYQIFEARAAGADAILLIVRILEKSQLKDYHDLAQELGMTALVEVHDEKEMETAIDFPLIGINNRDLDTLKIDLETTVKLVRAGLPAPPKQLRLRRLEKPARTFISESGISTSADIEKLQKVGVHAFLVGETLLKEKNPGKKLKELYGLR